MNSDRFITALRWLARVWNAALVIAGILELIGPDPYARANVPWHEYLAPFFLFGGPTLAFLLTWRWERVAGWVILGSYAAAVISGNLSRYALRGEWLPFSTLPMLALIFATPGLLYLICDILDTPRQRRQPRYSG